MVGHVDGRVELKAEAVVGERGGGLWEGLPRRIGILSVDLDGVLIQLDELVVAQRPATELLHDLGVRQAGGGGGRRRALESVGATGGELGRRAFELYYDQQRSVDPHGA